MTMKQKAARHRRIQKAYKRFMKKKQKEIQMRRRDAEEFLWFKNLEEKGYL